MGCQPICDCTLSMGNTGTDCTLLMEVTKKVLLQPVFDSTGTTRNGLLLSDTFNAAYFTALINQSDVSKRLFPLPGMKDVNDKREDPIMQTFTDGTSVFVRDGARKFDGMLIRRDGTQPIKRAIDSGRCGEMGMYLVDRVGNLWGILSDDKTKLYPFRLDSASLNGMFQFPTDTTVQAIKFSVTFHPDEQDACIGGIAYSELGGANPLLFAGLKTVHATFSALSTTSATVKLYTDFGTPIAPITVQGLTAPKFVSSVGGATSKVRNTTGGADVAVTVAEGTGTLLGTYVLTWTAQTTGNKIVVKPLLDGYDFAEVVAAPITIP